MSSLIEKMIAQKDLVLYHQFTVPFEFAIAANGGEKKFSFAPYFAVIKSLELIGPNALLDVDADVVLKAGARSFMPGGFGGSDFYDENNLGTITLDDAFGDVSEINKYITDKMYAVEETFFVKCEQSGSFSENVRCCIVVELYDKNPPALRIGDYPKRKYSTVVEISATAVKNTTTPVEFDFEKLYKKLAIRQIIVEPAGIKGSGYKPESIEDVSLNILKLRKPQFQNFDFDVHTGFQLNYQRKLDFDKPIETSGQKINFELVNANENDDIPVNIILEVEVFE